MPGVVHARTMYGMPNRAEERVELRMTKAEKARLQRAAERRGISLSDWARRRLAEAADEEGVPEDPVPPAPTADDITEALGAHAALRGSGLRRRVHAARKTGWTAGR